MKIFLRAFLYLFILALLTGVFYPLTVTLIANVVWPELSHGSLLKRDGVVRGSYLVAQKFSAPYYFWPRPSEGQYNANPSVASNLGPTSKKLKAQIEDRRLFIAKEHNSSREEVPTSLVTSSASGLDPHLFAEALYFQVPRIAKARGLNAEGEGKINLIIQKELYNPWGRLYEKSYANVLSLNIALDEAFGKMAQ